MAIAVADLISRVPPEAEERVRRVRDQMRATVQDALRSECRLVMRTAEEQAEHRQGAQVPVEIAPGHPAVLDRLILPDDMDMALRLARYRPALEQAKCGVTGLLDLHRELQRVSTNEFPQQITETELKTTADWATTLLAFLAQHDPLKKVLGVSEDFLGVYRYEFLDPDADEYAVNRATILLYWGVIGLVADWIPCAIEDLTLVVLTHELAHAYTQLGADIDGRRWPVRAFQSAETALTEGLAQYYTERVLRRLEHRHPGAYKVYEAMLPRQPMDYQGHKLWANDSSSEAVRRAMLEVRRAPQCELADFISRINDANRALRKGAQRIVEVLAPHDP